MGYEKGVSLSPDIIDDQEEDLVTPIQGNSDSVLSHDHLTKYFTSETLNLPFNNVRIQESRVRSG